MHKQINFNGAELAGATGARAPVLFLPRPEILGHILYVLSRFSGQIPEIPRPRPVVHLDYLEHFGASDYYISIIIWVPDTLINSFY